MQLILRLQTRLSDPIIPPASVLTIFDAIWRPLLSNKFIYPYSMTERSTPFSSCCGNPFSYFLGHLISDMLFRRPNHSIALPRWPLCDIFAYFSSPSYFIVSNRV